MKNMQNSGPHVSILRLPCSKLTSFYTGNEILTEEDHDNIRAFKIRMVSNMPRATFNQMRYAFRHKLQISSHYVIAHRLAVLSGVVPLLLAASILALLIRGTTVTTSKNNNQFLTVVRSLINLSLAKKSSIFYWFVLVGLRTIIE